MNKKVIILIVFFIFLFPVFTFGFNLEIPFYSFLGRSDDDNYGNSIEVFKSGIYITGTSYSSWDTSIYGNPINPYNGGSDAVVIKLNNSGELEWYTFLGGGDWERSKSITIANDGSIYVTGSSLDEWNLSEYGEPIYDHNSIGRYDIFVAKLDSSGKLVWYTFLGSNETDIGESIKVNSNNEIVLTGYSEESWDTGKYSQPIKEKNNFYNFDVLALKLNEEGHLIWYTFLGNEFMSDEGRSLAISKNDEIFLTGISYYTWDDNKYGFPKKEFSGGADIFVSKLKSNGSLEWYTFLGGFDNDRSFSISLSQKGNIFITGTGLAEWDSVKHGYPIKKFNGASEIFVAKLNLQGSLSWYTFLGSSDSDEGKSISVSKEGNIYITGRSYDLWDTSKYGTPIISINRFFDSYVAKLNNRGFLEWYSFYGGGSEDIGNSITISEKSEIYFAGSSNIDWDITKYGKPLLSDNGGIFFGKLSEVYEIVSKAITTGGELKVKKQNILIGSTCSIEIIVDNGYEIDKIIDNGREMEISNPYIIRDVLEDHFIQVSFKKIKYPPTLTLTGERKNERAWIISKDYIELDITMTEHESPIETAYFALMKNVNGIWVELKRYDIPGIFEYTDNDINKKSTCSYKLIAFDPTENQIIETEVLTL